MIKRYRLWMTSAMTLATFSFVAARLAYLQIYCHAALSERAERAVSRTHGLEDTARGSILDRDGKPLAMSIGGGACFADPRAIVNPDSTARALAPWLKVSSPVIRSKLTQHKKFVWLARRLDPETSQHLKDLKLPGVRVIPELKRFYPEENLASPVLGVIGEDENGLSGIELIASDWLNGRFTTGMFKEWKFNSGSVLPALRPADYPPNSVVVALDQTLQYIAEQQLAIQMTMSRAKHGTVIMIDPKTGDILAMANAPGFNPNLWGAPGASANFGPDTLRNPAVEHVFEPGSTFKIVSGAAALEENVIKPNDMVFCENGLWEHAGRKIHDHEREGILSFTDVIAHSSNIGVGKVALRLGADNLYRYARAFGFGMPSSCGLPGDGAGILRIPKEWSASSLATIAFGQEVGATPLQITNAYAVIANGGLLYEPRMFRGVINSKGEYLERQDAKPIRRVVSPHTCSMMREILRQVVLRGTGKAAQVMGITTAGKTGTAQMIDVVTHKYSAEHFIASFVGFAPVESPKVVVGVFLDEPQTSQWGGSEAAPLFSRIIRDAAPYLHMEVSPIGPMASAHSGQS